MRLGQLSRQLEVSSDKIVKVLADNFREVNNHPNIKITEEELAFLVVHFSPKTSHTEEASVEATDANETQIEALSEEIAPEIIEEEALPEFVESLRPQVITLEEEFNAQKEDLESYKAEKVELEGLKVVGKIELPEPPVKKEKTAPQKEEESEEIKSFDRKPRRNGKRSGNRKPRLNPIEYQRQKEEKLVKKKKEQEEKRKKELKKQHYETQVKSKLQQPSKKKKKKPIPNIVQVQPQATPPTPKKTGNPIKRFWLWLNGAYDKH